MMGAILREIEGHGASADLKTEATDLTDQWEFFAQLNKCAKLGVIIIEINISLV